MKKVFAVIAAALVLFCGRTPAENLSDLKLVYAVIIACEQNETQIYALCDSGQEIEMCTAAADGVTAAAMRLCSQQPLFFADCATVVLNAAAAARIDEVFTVLCDVLSVPVNCDAVCCEDVLGLLEAAEQPGYKFATSVQLPLFRFYSQRLCLPALREDDSALVLFNSNGRAVPVANGCEAQILELLLFGKSETIETENYTLDASKLLVLPWGGEYTAVVFGTLGGETKTGNLREYARSQLCTVLRKYTLLSGRDLLLASGTCRGSDINVVMLTLEKI